MMYSVWNQVRGGFDYYEDAKALPTVNAERPSHLIARTLGSTVEQAAWPLPSDAKPVGHGQVPVGRIARAGGVALGDSEESSWFRVGLLVAAGALAMRVLRPRRGR